MSTQKRRKHSSTFKTKVVLAAIKEQHTLAELASKFEISGVMISRWKREFLDNATAAFEKKNKSTEPLVNTEKLYAQIGELKVENDFLKKSCETLGI